MAATAWHPPSTLGHSNPAAFHQLASSLARPHKRRYEFEDDLPGARDASMDRSPTPERPKRAPPKRARVLPQIDGTSRPDHDLKENKAPVDDQDVDVGVLLASLPPQSLLPLLTSLLNAQPSLKSTILPLIPRPTLETAIQALSHSAKKLRDAYPYSSPSSFGQSTSFGFGRASNTNTSAFSSTHHNGGMRDSYIISRLRPHISEFVAACFSYLPYFSSQSALSNSTALQSLLKDKSHPSETFSFLYTVTNHIICQPALAQAELVQQLFPRLAEEWKAWIAKVDEVVNRAGGMFGSETVQVWARGLDEMADAKVLEGLDVMRTTRDLWVTKAAAGSAWARRASTSPNLYPKPFITPPDSALVQYLRRNQQSPTSLKHSPSPSTSSYAAYFEPDAVRDGDFLPSFHGCDSPSSELDHSDRPLHWDDTSIIGTPIGPSPQNTGTSRFPLAKDYTSLYQNLLRLIHHHNPPPSLPILLDYHDLHTGLRSTRSYNLLISLAMRTASYGTVRWLLESMRAERVPASLETWKWRVRWLVQSGMWDKAWRTSMEISPRTNERIKDEERVVFKVTNALPLPIWMEFFRTLKYGATRIRTRRRPHTITAPLNSSSSPDPLDLYSTRYHTLMNNRPIAIPHDLSRTPPKHIYHAVWTMLHVGQAETALSLTKSYFSCLPPRLPGSWYQTCLDILHLHIAKGSTQKGLRRLYESRRTLVSLLSIYPTLRPTSTTLFLLLSPLYRAKRCGTVAANTVRAFKSQYGSRSEDRRVRRRVALLALKEGRSDIVKDMLRRERGARWAHATWRLTRRVIGTAAKSWPRKLLRPPTRTIFRRNGQEERRWCRLITRVSRSRRYNRSK
ncbi:hypothetical protein C0991_005093 [Blastosporella zonata]|nr:hypothetical protein C0991_005093 [Blastosporella zonata]